MTPDMASFADHLETTTSDIAQQELTHRISARGRVFQSLTGEPDPCGPLPLVPNWSVVSRPRFFRPFPSERALADAVLERLSPWFHVEREVRGTLCTGAPARLDAIIRPRRPQLWRDPAPAFGIEFKRADGEINQYARWLGQVVDYSHAIWGEHGRVFILACPGILGQRADPAVEDVWTRMTGHLGIGELSVYFADGLSIRVSGDNYWSERRGPRRARHRIARPASGSR